MPADGPAAIGSTEGARVLFLPDTLPENESRYGHARIFYDRIALEAP
jgi:hypothetical protein